MPRTYDYANRQEDLNYLGELFMVGAFQTPFLNMAGGIEGARSKVTRSFIFPTAQPWGLRSASQPEISEAASVAAGTPTIVNRTQATNTVQIFKEDVEVSYAKQSTYGEIAGLASTETVGGQPVNDEFEFQKMAHLRQIAFDADYAFLNGAYQAAANAATAAKTRGIITACLTNNEVAANGGELTKAMIQSLMKEMATNGAVFENPVLFCNAYQKQKLSGIYGYAPESRTVGGVNIEQIYTDFAQLGVIWSPNVPTDTILVADMNYVYPVFCPVPGKGLVFYEDLAQVGASMKGQMYGQMGIDYGPVQYHGVITGLADRED